MSQRLIRSTSVVASMTMVSRLLGFIRDVVLAGIFGAGPTFDAFVVAFKLPNFMRRLFADGAFSQAFVPVLAEYREKNSHEETVKFVQCVTGTLGFAVMMVVLLAEIIAPFIIMVFAPGFMHDPVRFGLATHMLRITFPYLLLISLTALGGAVLNTWGRFAIPAFTPTLLNISMIAVAWFWAPHTSVPIYVLAWGVVIGGVLQLSIQLPYIRKIKLLALPKLSWKETGVLRVMKLMIPALFGVSVAQMSLLIDNFFASFLPAGSISWLYYSDRLVYLPLGVIGVALATVVMPNLSRQHSRGSKETYCATLDWALRCVFVIGMPAAIGLFVLAGPLLATLIHHGAFNDYDVMQTQKSLMAFALGLPAFMLIKILASAFYSRQNIKTPVKVAAISVLANLVLNVALVFPLAHAGLALATSLSSTLNAFLLLILLLRSKVYQPLMGWRAVMIRVLFANTMLALFIYWLRGDLAHWIKWSLFTRSWHLLVIITVALMFYFIVLYVSGARYAHFKPPV